jgi:uncharacterized protein YkwD
MGDVSHKKAIIPLGKNIGTQGDDPAEDALAAHNRLRANHNAKPMHLDAKLCGLAQKHADYLVGLGKDIKAQHSKHAEKYGEGVQIVSKYRYPVHLVIEAWYKDEAGKFNWNNRSFQDGCGHMTQIIWKETKKLGVGYASEKKPDRTAMVFLYDPTGNVYHTFGKNVEAPKK